MLRIEYGASEAYLVVQGEGCTKASVLIERVKCSTDANRRDLLLLENDIIILRFFFHEIKIWKQKVFGIASRR